MRELELVPKLATKPKREFRVRVPQQAGLARFFLRPFGRVLLVGFTLITVLCLGVFLYFYVKYARVIDERLRAGVFANSAKIFAAAETVGVGDAATPNGIAAELRRSGYNESRGNPVGYYQVGNNSIEVFPGKDSYFDQEAGLIRFARGKISEIVSLRDNTERSLYQLEPQLITNLTGPTREKRRMVKFHDIPPILVEAVTSAEDKRFFQHAGFDPIRIIKAFYVDLKEGRKDQGASTLSMQLARMFFLDQDKRWTRKAAEAIITLQLEQKLSKEEIFEDYCNQIYLGYRGSFRIRGFGEAAEAFLGKDLSQITLPEAAQLAGLPRWPAYFDPYNHPDHAKERRNVVLSMMRTNGYISDRDYALAIEAPLTVARGTTQSVEAPYFVDLVNDALQTKFQDENFQSNAFRVYTTLDMHLQRAATEAIRKGMVLVDEQIKKQRRFKGQTPPQAQVALVAIDPQTGEVKALAGGRNYGMSQLNHVLAKRQPGSIFKPFVYAAALDTGVEGGARVFTASTIVEDEPTTFWFDGKPYEPSNFEKDFMGEITLRTALARSRNVATVKVAEMVGYDKVVDMANRAGMNYKIQPTPAVALGSYEITPLEAAGAYTMFSNRGNYVKPSFLKMVRDGKDGKKLFENKLEEKHVLDPRVAYLVTSLMEEVLRTGTAAGIPGKYGLRVPAAGKTGTSHDGWFAGFTSELLCVVWVGFDDNEKLELQGAYSAAPIWAEFMKSALDYREYRGTKPFQAPDGIVSIDIDPETGMPANSACPTVKKEFYIAGTEPVGACPKHGVGRQITNVAGWETAPAEKAPSNPGAAPASTAPRIVGSGGDGQVAPAAVARRAARQEPPEPASAAAQPEAPEPDKKDPKKGFWNRLKGVFKK
ncbi:Penicillin-binding protein, 1A family [Candidatus Sulfopaludibacter sp. SbA4]|nr:Penicillin-binding protein, 1A family [Candidatus Sulfopaludibacter sp. SbA4]